jgi:hypothetical protein
MLNKSQIVKLIALGFALWVLVTLSIRLRPQSLLDPVRGEIPFITAPVAGWLSVLLCRWVGGHDARRRRAQVVLLCLRPQ